MIAINRYIYEQSKIIRFLYCFTFHYLKNNHNPSSKSHLKKALFFSYGHLWSQHEILNNLARLRLLVRTAFCIPLNVCLPLSPPTIDLLLFLSRFEYPPSTSITILTCFISKHDKTMDSDSSPFSFYFEP